MRLKIVPFLDVFEDVSGGNIKTPQSEFLAEGDVPVVDQGQGLVAGYVTDKSRVCKAKPPVIVFGDHTRIIKYVDFQFAMGADGTKVLASRNGDHPKYLYYALQAIQIPSAGYSRHYKFLKETEIPLPPLAEQKRIAGILDAADALRAKRRDTLAQLHQYRGSAFSNLFGKPLSDSRWQIMEVGEVGDVQLGRQRAPKYQTGKHTKPYVRVANVYEDEIDISDVLSMDFDDRDFDTYQLRDEDILLNEGQSTELVGRPAMWQGEIPNCCFQNTLVRFRADRSKVTPAFALEVFLYYLRSGETCES